MLMINNWFSRFYDSPWMVHPASAQNWWAFASNCTLATWGPAVVGAAQPASSATPTTTLSLYPKVKEAVLRMHTPLSPELDAHRNAEVGAALAAAAGSSTVRVEQLQLSSEIEADIRNAVVSAGMEVTTHEQPVNFFGNQSRL